MMIGKRGKRERVGEVADEDGEEDEVEDARRYSREAINGTWR